MIEIPVSFGELVDKITILELKGYYIKDKSKSVHIKHELQLLEKLYKEYYNTGDLPIRNHIYDLKGKLYEVNSGALETPPPPPPQEEVINVIFNKRYNLI